MQRWLAGKAPQYILANGIKCQILQRGVKGHSSITKIKVLSGQKVTIRRHRANADTVDERPLQYTSLVLYVWSEDVRKL